MTVLTVPLGSTTDLTLDVDPADATTAATVVLDAPTGPDQAPTATLGPAVTGTTARTLTATGSTFDETGTWYAVWTVTGTGHGTAVQEIRVTAVPAADATPTFDPATAVGQVRLLISDLDPGNLLFTDAHIGAFLAMNGDAVKLAAAQALESAAGNEAQVSKVIRAQVFGQEVSTDGAKVAAELRALAGAYRSQHAEVTDADVDGFVIVDFDPNPWGAELAEWPRY